MNHDLECPYCDAELEINHDDGFGYEEGKKHEMQCGKCEKNFVFETSISFYFEPEKADCLNDGEHEWKANTTFPIRYSMMCCQSCGEERTPTGAEMSLIVMNDNKRKVIRTYPDAYCKQYATFSFVIWSGVLKRQLSGYLKTEAEAWESGVQYIENKRQKINHDSKK